MGAETLLLKLACIAGMVNGHLVTSESILIQNRSAISIV